MDSSNFPLDHPLHDAAREGKLGLLKFETSDPEKAFLGLKAKMYCFQTLQSCKKNCEGRSQNSFTKRCIRYVQKNFI